MSKLSDFAATDLCVKCGLCLPHCPTYRLSQDESESPRGRLALMQGWAEGSLQATPALQIHLDNCLSCRRCEAVCPAKVPYGRLLDDFRAVQPRANDGLMGQLARKALANAVWRKGLAALARRYGRASWRPLLRRLAPAPLEASAHTAAPLTLQTLYPAQGRETARAALFVGCTGAWLDAETLQAAIAVLTRLGVAVSVPPGQGCCGALHWHAGDRSAATPLLERNRAAFAQADAIVTITSGCGSFLQEQGGLGRSVVDISRFLLDLLWPADAPLRPSPAKVALHSPCSLGDSAAPAQLLRKIPDLVLTPLPAQPGCCGAAGTYMLGHADWAKRLRDEIVGSVAASGASYVVTSNVGCAAHLRNGLIDAGLASVAVLHPVVLLGRSL